MRLTCVPPKYSLCVGEYELALLHFGQDALGFGDLLVGDIHGQRPLQGLFAVPALF